MIISGFGVRLVIRWLTELKFPTGIRVDNHFRIKRVCRILIGMKVTRYFISLSARPDRAQIKSKWIQRVVDCPEAEQIQTDGRIRRWGKVPEMDNRNLRVILLSDGETVHNAFFDRGFKS